ncbi:ABC-ATPase domain-containing protein [Brevibacillus humidisoli]|uniref:ABC-ATPase domain-containing protein n=1 Tax=Brevibacillus humidisoli TaxID=2895522 RepID=UPI001E2FAEAB|nr:ABC-ATPase domain-containing protein [Brevibacillus humidisoli]UFJ42766.1 ABC-ATPase domain-containing protein [Brevibacillus humidisoli]
MEQLQSLLKRLDGRGYKAYKEIHGTYRGQWFQLLIDHVQADPFAAPSRIRFTMKRDPERIGDDCLQSPWRRVASEDYLAREVAAAIRKAAPRREGMGKSGLIAIDAPGQEVLQRTAVKITEQTIEVRLSVGLPAAGRTILGHAAAQLLTQSVPSIVKQAIFEMDQKQMLYHLQLADQQQAIRQYLRERGWVSFVANGSILPRESGVSNRPLRSDRVIPFQSPASLEVEVPIPHQQEPLRGMAIPAGITLIVGGGYHGKSTLLKAIERGVYNHIPGDGREYVLTDQAAVRIRAEDGRNIEGVDISPFIQNLPFGQNTERFSTQDASGSTSQAANIIEAMELGCKLLLIDEDTSANNFMMRDAKMQRLVQKEKEPITPFIDRARQLYEQHGVSTILVLGGSGDYFGIADRVIMMDEYKAIDVTGEAKAIARENDDRKREGGSDFGQLTPRVPLPGSFPLDRRGRDRVDAKGRETILLGDQRIDLSAVEQLVDQSQTYAIAEMLRHIASRADGRMTLAQLIGQLFDQIEADGLESISRYVGRHPGDLALPRRFEVAAAINRLRSLHVTS